MHTRVPDPYQLVERLVAIVDSSHEAIISIDNEGIIETWNDAASRLCSYGAEEMVGQSLLLITPPDLHHEEKSRLELVRAGERIEPYESYRLCKGGNKIRVSISMSPIRNSIAEVIGAALILRDISIPGQDEVMRARLASIIECSDDAIIAKDLNGVITNWNTAAEKTFGYTAEEMIGRSILTIIPPERQHEEAMILGNIRAGKPVEHFETQRLHKSGRRIDVILTSSPIRDARGRIIGASKIARDITDRRKAENARLLLAAIVESSDDAIISKNLDSIITSWNAAAERLFGYKPEEIIGQSVMRLMPRDLYKEEPEIISRLRAGKRIEHFETRRMRKNGEIFDVSLTVSPIKDDTGRVIGASKIVRDISDRKAAEAALVEKEKLAATGRLAATLAHEVNNPLEAIANLAFLLSRHANLDKDARAYADLLLREVQRAGDIARRTLSFYRESTQQIPIDLAEMLRHILEAKQKKISERRIRLEGELAELPAVSGFRGELRQVLENLLENAIDAVECDGVIRIRTRSYGAGEERRVAVSICDSGCGIPAEVRKRIFDPFFTTKQGKGSGLGLWVSRSIVIKHRGTLRVRSSSNGRWRGTVFVVNLPAPSGDAVSEPLQSSKAVKVA